VTKSDSGADFINVKRTNFLYERRFGSFYYVHVIRRKLPKQRSYEKFARLTLMKLTAGQQNLFMFLAFNKFKGKRMFINFRRNIQSKEYPHCNQVISFYDNFYNN